MKDVFDQLMDAERRFYGGGEQGHDNNTCSFCKQRFYPEELTEVGEQVIDGRYVETAFACVRCDPTDYD